MPQSMRKLAWDMAPLLMLASASVALARSGGRGGQAGKANVLDAGHGREAHRIGPGRGRRAHGPGQIPRRGWKDILQRTRKEIGEDQVPLIAAGVAFYTLLALFPGLAAFVALYGLFADPAAADRHVEALAVLLPRDAIEFIGLQMRRLAAAQTGGLSLAFIVGLLASIWSAGGAVRAMITGLNIAYEEDEKRGFVRKALVSLAFTLGFLAFIICAAAVLAAGPTVEAIAGQRAAMIVGLASWPLLVVALGAGLAILYRYGPSRDAPKLRWISWGSGLALLLWLAMSWLFSLYVSNFANYDETYGSLGAVVGFMFWSWLSAAVILAGAELNSEIEHQTAVDTTVGRPRAMGSRRARMADTLGAPQG